MDLEKELGDLQLNNGKFYNAVIKINYISHVKISRAKQIYGSFSIADNLIFFFIRILFKSKSIFNFLTIWLKNISAFKQIKAPTSKEFISIKHLQKSYGNLNNTESKNKKIKLSELFSHLKNLIHLHGYEVKYFIAQNDKCFCIRLILTTTI